MEMISTKSILLLCFLLSLSLSSSAQSCSYTFTNNTVFSSCLSLQRLGAFLHWTYNSTLGSVDIAYRATRTSNPGWISWGINPSGTRMIGTQALVAARYANGSLITYLSPLINKNGMIPGNLSFTVTKHKAEVVDNTVIIMYATIQLQGNGTTVNHLWQEGSIGSNGPNQHSISGENVQSMGQIDFLSGQGSSSGDSKTRRKNIHGILNAVSWGIMMPLGIIIARYLRVFVTSKPVWFYLHVSCQVAAYIIGVAGWATGMKLGSESSVSHDTHRNIGIALFSFGTLQVFALLLRPKPDHKYRLYWNIYHHGIGYTIVVLSIVNIFKGFNILNPEKKWKNTYIGVIAALGAIALIFEAIKWPIVIRRKSKSNAQMGQNGVNA